MKNLLVILVLATMALVSCQSKNYTAQTEDEKSFYALGVMLASRFANLSMTESEINSLTQGIRDGVTNTKPQVDPAVYQAKLQTLFKDRMELSSNKTKAEGKAAIDKFVKEEGAKMTDSGLAYKIIKDGTGKNPKADDMVEVHYHGTLIDGTVFDSSVERGKTVTFPLNRVIKGWTEGLQLVKEGGKIKLMIPSDLAYGNAGAPPKIPAGATLIFDVDLVAIKAAPEMPKMPMPIKKKGNGAKALKK